MTIAARQVLRDCRLALDDLRACNEAATWRRRWVATMVLLRAVGHVLNKVDAVTDPALAEVMQQWWKGMNGTKPEPAIFWRFIEEERNLVVKEYQSNAVLTVKTTVAAFSLATGEKLEVKPPEHRVVMDSGHFEGREQLDLVSEAITWWEEQIATLESAAPKDAA